MFTLLSTKVHDMNKAAAEVNMYWTKTRKVLVKSAGQCGYLIPLCRHHGPSCEAPWGLSSLSGQSVYSILIITCNKTASNTVELRYSATVRRHLWRYDEGGGTLKYVIVENFCLQTFVGAKRGWRYFGVWL